MKYLEVRDRATFIPVVAPLLAEASPGGVRDRPRRLAIVRARDGRTLPPPWRSPRGEDRLRSRRI